MIGDVCSDIPNTFWHKKRHIVNLSYVEDFPTNVLIQEPRIGSCHYFTEVFKGNVRSAKMLITTDCPNILNVSSQESEHTAWISTTNKWNNNTYTTSKWINMTSSREKHLHRAILKTKGSQLDNLL